MSNGNDDEKPKRLIEHERLNKNPPRDQKAGVPAKQSENREVGLGIGHQMKNYVERKTLESETRLVEAKTENVDAHTNLYKSGRKLRETVFESREWDEEKERAKIRKKYEMEDLELDDEVAERRFQNELNRRRREAELNPPPPPPRQNRKGPSSEEQMKQYAENMLKHGTTGRNSTWAEEKIAVWLEPYDGDFEQAPPELQERIRQLRLEATRRDQSKSP